MEVLVVPIHAKKKEVLIMAQNIIVSIFEVESEAYQAFTTLKQEPYTEKSFLKQVILGR